MGNMEKKERMLRRSMGRRSVLPVTEVNRALGNSFLARLAATMNRESALKRSIVGDPSVCAMSVPSKPDGLVLYGIRTVSRRFCAVYTNGVRIGLFRKGRHAWSKGLKRLIRRFLSVHGTLTIIVHGKEYKIYSLADLDGINMCYVHVEVVHHQKTVSRMTGVRNTGPSPTGFFGRGPPVLYKKSYQCESRINFFGFFGYIL